MTAPIRVVRDPWCELDRHPWRAFCSYCGPLGSPYVSWDGAMWEAEQHAAEPCDGIRLALLVQRLRYRQDGYKRARSTTLNRGDVALAAAYRLVIDNIDHDVKRATR